MMKNKTEKLAYILGGLMRRYKQRVPDVQKILNALVERGAIRNAEDIVNDHIAFRTIGVPMLGIQSLERIFLHYGYERRSPYRFEKKHLDAYWYEHENHTFPRIFISQLCVDELSEHMQSLIKSYTKEVRYDPTIELDLDKPEVIDKFLHSSLWRMPSLEDYNSLLEESEYASWVIYNRYYLNHYTISIHELDGGYDTIAAFNELIESIGIKLNSSGGKVKTSEDNLLLQSATVAQMINAEFADKQYQKIAGSYVEFAERKVLPQFQGIAAKDIKRHQRRNGFEASNADKIFESTYTKQIKH